MLSCKALTSVTAPPTKRRRLSYAQPLSLRRNPPPRLRAVSMEPLESRSEDASLTWKQMNQGDFVPNPSVGEGEGGEEDEEEEAGISRIQVSRQRYIQVSKVKILDAIVLKLFNSEDDDDADQFLLLSSCLDSILHAEHKSILEQMRSDYFHSHPMEDHEISEDFDVSRREEGASSESLESPETVPNGKVSNSINGNGSVGEGYGEDREQGQNRQLPQKFDSKYL